MSRIKFTSVIFLLFLFGLANIFLLPFNGSVSAGYEIGHLRYLSSSPVDNVIFFTEGGTLNDSPVTSINSFEPSSQEQKILFFGFQTPTDLNISSDGKRIVFILSLAQSSPSLWLVNNKGLQFHQLTNHQRNIEDKYPLWSPDGKKIVFLRSDRHAGLKALRSFISGQLWVVDVETGQERRLNDKLSNREVIDWSGDGREVYFVEEGNIWAVEVDSNKKRQLIKGKHIDYLRTSPNGQKVLFLARASQSKEDETTKWRWRINDYHLWVMDSNGRNLKQLSKKGENIWSPVWSPSGKEIIFHRFDSDYKNGHISLLDLATGRSKELTSGEVKDSYPVWLTDGTRIAFIRNEKTIWIMNADGTNQRQLYPPQEKPAQK
jgi:TolB protein